MAGDGYRVGVLGATGLVGTTILELLADRELPGCRGRPLRVRALRRPRDRVERHRTLICRGLSEDSIQGLDLVLSSAGGSVSAEWAPRFVEAGAVVVDNTSHFRMDDDVPLVVAEVNPDAAEGHSGIIANPNCSTMQMVVALKPLHDEAGIERLVISTYQAVSGTGKAAVDELLEQSRAVLDGRDPVSSVYPHQIAFNVLPQAGSFAEGDDHTDEERKLINETRKILGDASIRVSATCVRVPVVTGHSEAVNVETREPALARSARASCSPPRPASPSSTTPAAAAYPMAIDAVGRDDVFVGRIRRDPGNERAIDLWIVSDNLRKGAATNAVQVAELLVEREPARRRRASADGHRVRRRGPALRWLLDRRRGALRADARHRPLGLRPLGRARHRARRDRRRQRRCHRPVDRRADRAGADPHPLLRRDVRRARAAAPPLEPGRALAGDRDADHDGAPRARRQGALSPPFGWSEAFLLGAVLSPTDPVVTSAVVTSPTGAERRPPHAQPRVRAQRRARPPVRPLLPRPRHARRRSPAPKRRSSSARPSSAASIGVALGAFGGRLHTAFRAAASPPATRASTRSGSPSSPSASPTSPSATA